MDIKNILDMENTFELFARLSAATTDLMSVYERFVYGDGVIDKFKFLDAINEAFRVEFALMNRCRDERVSKNK